MYVYVYNLSLLLLEETTLFDINKEVLKNSHGIRPTSRFTTEYMDVLIHIQGSRF